MSGWKRLWVVLSVLWVLPASFISLLSYSEVRIANEAQYVVERRPIIIEVDPNEQFFSHRNPGTSSEFTSFCYCTPEPEWRFDEDLFFMRNEGLNDPSAKAARMEVYRNAAEVGVPKGRELKERKLGKAWRIFIFGTGAVFILPPAVLYALGLAVGWVWRGFRPADPE